MSVLTILWLALCALGLALSARSVGVLRGRSRATVIGWLLTAAYFALAAIDAARATAAPYHLDYLLLAALTLAFIVAGTRDEPQAEPWWWPTHVGPTGKERRARVR